jgi:hypothetical protein
MPHQHHGVVAGGRWHVIRLIVVLACSMALPDITITDDATVTMLSQSAQKSLPQCKIAQMLTNFSFFDINAMPPKRAGLTLQQLNSPQNRWMS